MLINQSVQYNASDHLSLIFSALADPTRRAILEVLFRGEATVNELARPFNISLPAISKHLKVLERAGLISRGQKAQWRPCRIEAQALQDVSEWANHYRALWEGSLDGLDAYLKQMQANGTIAKKQQEPPHS